MLGAILGDIAGSMWEFREDKGFWLPLYDRHESTFTDDTILSIATAEALMGEKDFKQAYIDYFARFSNGDTNGPYTIGPGFGAGFVAWAMGDNDHRPYNSYGNGSAMRVSAVAWFAKSLEEALTLAEQTALPTHNHPEGVKGAQATALAIYLSLQGADPATIRHELKERFGYRLMFNLDALHETYTFNEISPKTVPQAIFCALEASSFEETLRNVLYIGGDTDTLGAIAGAIAEARYGIPEALREQLIYPLKTFCPELHATWRRFDRKFVAKRRPPAVEMPLKRRLALRWRYRGGNSAAP